MKVIIEVVADERDDIVTLLREIATNLKKGRAPPLPSTAAFVPLTETVHATPW